MNKSRIETWLEEKALTEKPGIIFFLILLFVHISIIPGMFLAVRIGRPRFLGLAIYAVVGLLIFDVLYILSQNNRLTLYRNSAVPRLLMFDWRVSAIGIIFAFIITIVTERDILPMLLILFVFSLLFYRILVFRVDDRKFNINTMLTIGASATLIIFHVFTVEYPVHSTDTIRHAFVVKHIVRAGSLSELASTRYRGFLIYHVLASMGVKITNVSVRPLISMIAIGLFQTALLSIVLAFRRWFSNKTLILIVGALFAFNEKFVIWASKAHYQSLSFVYLCIFFFVLTVQVYDKRATVLGVFVLCSWIGTHHLSFVMALSLATVPFCIGIFVYRAHSWSRSIILQYILVLIFLFGYWTIVTKEIVTPITWIFAHSPAASFDVSSTQILILTYDSADELLSASLPVFFSYSHLSLLLALCILGLIYLIYEKSHDDIGRKRLLVISAFITSGIFYFPNPLWIPLRGVGVLLRWGIMCLPFLLVIPSYGVYYLSERGEGISAASIITGLIIISLIFTTIGAGAVSPTILSATGNDRMDQNYLSERDIQAVSFTNAYSTTGQKIYGTSFTPVYGFNQKRANDPSLQNTQYSRIKADRAARRFVIEEGLTIFQEKAFENGALKIRLEPDSERYEDADTISAPVTNNEIQWDRDSANLVYSNGDTVIQQRS